MKTVTHNSIDFKSFTVDSGDLWDRLLADALRIRERVEAGYDAAWSGAKTSAHGLSEWLTRRAAGQASQRIPASRMALALEHMRVVASAHTGSRPATHDLPGTGAGLRFTVALVDGAPRVTRIFYARG